MDILLATYRAAPGLTPSDRLLADALVARGAAVRSAPWDAVDPSDAGAAVCIRSTWDYHLRIGEFGKWVAAFRGGSAPLINAPDTVLWNLDKAYLRSLDRLGIPLPMTRWLPEGATPDLASLFAETGWREAVLKPRVSASAHGTILVTPGSEWSGDVAAGLAATGGLFQEFIPEIRTRGEVSLMFFGGEFSHAVRKEAADGEFRVQPHLGGGARVVEAPAGLREFGARVLECIATPWAYARVDVVEAQRGPLLMELELVEPELFFHLVPEGADRLAECLIALVGRRPER